ncbi:MAG: hypothetical protein IPI49_22935 [Myxococcales bacterium]|nr:hypothetical protein [Myxococcales bacterium]
MRLATGQGTVADARFMVHESHEIGLMEQAGVDFMGDGLTPNTPQHDAWYNGTFEPAYMAAHRQALRRVRVSRRAGGQGHRRRGTPHS